MEVHMHRFHRSFPLKAAAAAVALLAAASLSASPKAETQTAPQNTPGYGQGMMRAGQSDGPGMMGGGRMGRGMRGGPDGTGTGQAWQGEGRGQQGQTNLPLLDKPLTLDGAVGRVQTAIKDWGYQDLVVDEVIQYSFNYYVLVKEKSTGKGAVELIVDPRTGAVNFEPGPNMMWNSKYGHMGRGMGWNVAPGAAAITADEAKQVAAKWLEQSGDTTAWTLDVTEMYGYYSIHLVRDGKPEAMLAVNAATREVWFHSWHGPYIAGKEIKG
jgi:hypothetical protein